MGVRIIIQYTSLVAPLNRSYVSTSSIVLLFKTFIGPPINNEKWFVCTRYTQMVMSMQFVTRWFYSSLSLPPVGKRGGGSKPPPPPPLGFGDMSMSPFPYTTMLP